MLLHDTLVSTTSTRWLLSASTTEVGMSIPLGMFLLVEAYQPRILSAFSFHDDWCVCRYHCMASFSLLSAWSRWANASRMAASLNGVFRALKTVRKLVPIMTDTILFDRSTRGHNKCWHTNSFTFSAWRPRLHINFDITKVEYRLSSSTFNVH